MKRIGPWFKFYGDTLYKQGLRLDFLGDPRIL
jgi:hypothetical protein